MNEHVCNYALIRFLPYRDAGEFVNIGVALACAPLGFLDFRVEARRWARVSHFFPDLEIGLYHEGMRALRAECDRWRNSASLYALKRLEGNQAVPHAAEAFMRHIFGELTRASESVFHFGTPRTVLAVEPEAKLEELFVHYVRRQFVAEPPHGEEAMRQKIAQSLREFGVERLYRPARIGTQDYYVQFPFVAEGATQLDLPLIDTARRVIKPLDLNRDEPSEISQHGDEWYMRVFRLREIGHLPPQLLFPVQEPMEGKRHIAAAQKVRRELEGLGTVTIDFNDNERLLSFAQAGELN